jgi:ribonuclease R
MGDKIRIKIVAANLTKRQLDYEWVINTALAEDKQEELVENKKEHKKKKSRKRD